MSKEVSTLFICTSLFIEFFAVASCICLRFKFEWHMVDVVEAMHIFMFRSYHHVPCDNIDLAVLALSVSQCRHVTGYWVYLGRKEPIS